MLTDKQTGPYRSIQVHTSIHTSHYMTQLNLTYLLVAEDFLGFVPRQVPSFVAKSRDRSGRAAVTAPEVWKVRRAAVVD